MLSFSPARTQLGRENRSARPDCEIVQPGFELSGERVDKSSPFAQHNEPIVAVARCEILESYIFLSGPREIVPVLQCSRVLSEFVARDQGICFVQTAFEEVRGASYMVFFTIAIH